MKSGLFVFLGSVIFFFVLTGTAFACGCGGGSGQMTAPSMGDQCRQATTAPAIGKQAINVGNTICPVMGGKIDGNSKVTYEYEGKIYNFCCSDCVEAFKKDPQKYISMVEKELAARPR